MPKTHRKLQLYLNTNDKRISADYRAERNTLKSYIIISNYSWTKERIKIILKAWPHIPVQAGTDRTIETKCIVCHKQSNLGMTKTFFGQLVRSVGTPNVSRYSISKTWNDCYNAHVTFEVICQIFCALKSDSANSVAFLYSKSKSIFYSSTSKQCLWSFNRFFNFCVKYRLIPISAMLTSQIL